MPTGLEELDGELEVDFWAIPVIGLSDSSLSDDVHGYHPLPHHVRLPAVRRPLAKYVGKPLGTQNLERARAQEAASTAVRPGLSRVQFAEFKLAATCQLPMIGSSVVPSLGGGKDLWK